MNFKYGIPTMTRRQFLNAGAATGLAFAGAGLAGCGSSKVRQPALPPVA
jgi:hypothetical protein